MKNFEELQECIIGWGESKGIMFDENHPKQLMKVVEELGELSGSILKGNRIAEEDSFGDVLVTLIILAKQRDINITIELENAYNTIKDRVGKTINGTFVKEN
jgi:NTP pyrophosphatase (non-canonical NTP hydrolase)